MRNVGEIVFKVGLANQKMSNVGGVSGVVGPVWMKSGKYQIMWCFRTKGYLTVLEYTQFMLFPLDQVDKILYYSYYIKFEIHLLQDSYNNIGSKINLVIP